MAGISAEYYIRLERGNVTGASEGVLDGVAHALQLTDAERGHLYDLVRAAADNQAPRRRRPAQVRVRPAVQRILDALTLVPAFVVDSHLDLLASNALGRALYAPLYDRGEPAPNQARFAFLDRRSTEFWRDWDETADDTVALLRASAGKDPYDRALSDLVGELSTCSDEFRVRWGAHNVISHNSGLKRIHHPVVGDLDLPFEGAALPADPGQFLLMFTAEADSAAFASLQLLASWYADQVQRPAPNQSPDRRP